MEMLESMITSPVVARSNGANMELTAEDIVTSKLKHYHEIREADWPESFVQMVAWWSK